MPTRTRKTGKGKRRANKRRHKKPQTNAITKQNEKSINTHKMQHQYHCFIKPIYTGSSPFIELWSVFHINIACIHFYIDKLAELEGTVYDSINILSYHQIKKCAVYPLRIIFMQKQHHLNNALSVEFRSKKDRNYWYNTIQKIFANNNKQLQSQTDTDISQKYNDSNVIYFGEVLLNGKHLLIMVLSAFSNHLYFYKKYDRRYQNRILFRIIDLMKYSEIIVNINTKSESLFEYNLILAGNENCNKNIVLSFKKNNCRHEWFAHIDYIMNHNINPISENIFDSDEKKVNDIDDNTKSLKVLLNVLKLYDEFNENDTDNKELKLNISYVSILDHFNNLIEFFDSNVSEILEHCEKMECVCMNRFQMERNNTNRNRRIRNERNDTLLLSNLLDKIHCFIFHSDNEKNMNIQRPNLQNKFVIPCSRNEEQKNNNNEETHINNECNEEILSFAFGEALTFYDNKYNNFVNGYYSTLKQELTSNPYYKLTINEYYNYYIKALHFKKTKYCQNITANNVGLFNQMSGIDTNDKLSINHIICLMTYCNEDELQRIFKQKTRKINNSESKQNVLKRLSYICHWIKYLNEATVFFGTSMDENEFVYCGMDKKLMFNTFQITNYSPLSTSSEITIANNFATNHGIILKFQHSSAINCRYFDMQFVSNFMEEKEMFFCGLSKLSICDIIIEGKSNSNVISSLKLLELILNGCIFVYEFNQSQLTQTIIKGSVYLLNEYIKQYEENTNEFVENKNYFIQLTTALMDSYLNRNKENDPFGRKRLFVNIPQLKQLGNKQLLSYFLPASVLINKFKERNVRPEYIKKVFRIECNKRKLNQIKRIEAECEYDNTIEVANFEINECAFRCFMDKGNDDLLSICIHAKPKVFHYAIPAKIEVLLDVVCKEVKYQNIQSTKNFCQATDYFSGIKLFPCSKLSGLNCLTIDLNFRII